eukprot:TRINITY_DN24549_c0_g2_i4.p1 TRINITY_DN24549_c0_g2~~TRINITY_DN24549_c0_g2_i4.p1  ORF type:complete len:472 (-),score=56.62 TRINITY_DN24549_c0_g2_i4:330-1745(-)
MMQCIPNRGLYYYKSSKNTQGSFINYRCNKVLQRAQIAATDVSADLFSWLHEHGAPEQKVKLTSMVDGVDGGVEVTVAAQHLNAGDTAIAIPSNLVVTLDRVFEDETVAELLTTDKISELACLALYLCYEKKRGKESMWYPFIKCLDKQRARGPQAVESPLLWEPEEVQRLLKGSPILDALKARRSGIEKEYENLDTVWFMAGSLFRDYPYDVPTEQFPFEVFLQAFAAVQSSIVHLQNVPPAKRFALLPLGPPMLTYSSTSRGMIAYDNDQVVLRVDKEYEEGQPVVAWCGPQPNSRLFVNYGIVDEKNPYDKLQMTLTIPNSDPLYQMKRSKLQHVELATQQQFQLQRDADLPPMLLPYMRLACSSTAEDTEKVQFLETAAPFNTALESSVLRQLTVYLQSRLEAYPTTQEQDLMTIQNSRSTQREISVAKLLRIEKQVLSNALQQVQRRTEALGSVQETQISNKVRIS